MFKPAICLDFDGVVHSYTSKWTVATEILDPPTPGAIAFLREAVKHFTVYIHSSRSHVEGGVRAMREWLGYWMVQERLSDDEELSWASPIEFPTHKPAALIYIDDRAICFTGTFPTIEEIKAFKPWNKK